MVTPDLSQLYCQNDLFGEVSVFWNQLLFQIVNTVMNTPLTHQRPFEQGKPVQKGLCIVALSIAVVIFILFLADLILGFIDQGKIAPFKYAPGMIVDIVFVIVSGILAIMSWKTFRQQV